MLWELLYTRTEILARNLTFFLNWQGFRGSFEISFWAYLQMKETLVPSLAWSQSAHAGKAPGKLRKGFHVPICFDEFVLRYIRTLGLYSKKERKKLTLTNRNYFFWEYKWGTSKFQICYMLFIILYLFTRFSLPIACIHIYIDQYNIL